ncbi:MAG: alpha/beta hydrolase [Verrucomicrobia bacterium]|nr:alpha/beta hydrolase [Verrucomicrobiota bacterium]
MKLSRPIRRGIAVLVLGFVGFAGVSVFFAWRFTTPPRRAVEAPSPGYLSSYESVTFPARDGIPLSGWFVPCPGSTSAVVLLHGNGSSRAQMLARARFFHARGFAVLLYDARGQGQSGGNLVSFGWYETRDLLGALDWLRARGFSSLGCDGVSQGGATIALAAADLHGLRWAILESTYPTLTDAIDCRFRHKVHVPGWLAACLMVPIAELRLGVNIRDISPRDTIAKLSCPVLIMSGERDEHTPLAHAREVFDRAPEPKFWHAVPGAAHIDLYSFDPAAYERQLDAFLATVR